MYTLTLYAFQKMSRIYIKLKDIHKVVLYFDSLRIFYVCRRFVKNRNIALLYECILVLYIYIYIYTYMVFTTEGLLEVAIES